MLFGDAGATHSGNFWTWVLASHWLTGKRIVAEGYSAYDVRYSTQKFPIEWINEKKCWISFVERNRNDQIRKALVVIDK